MDRSGGVKRERETSLFSCQKVVWPDRMGSEGAEWSGAQSTEIIMRSSLRGGERVELVINEANRKADLVGRLQASAVL